MIRNGRRPSEEGTMQIGLDQGNLTRIIHEHMRDQYPFQWKELNEKGLYSIIAAMIDGVVLAIEANNNQIARQLSAGEQGEGPALLEL